MHEQRRLLPDSQMTDILVHNSSGAPVRSSPDAMRELLGAVFRNRRVLKITFLLTFGGALLAVFLFGVKYEADTQILVKHRRADEVVSTDTSSRDPQPSTDVPTEREINTEISLLKSQDLLRAVVKDLGLDKVQRHSWDSLLPWHDEQWSLARATRGLSDGLKITEVPQSNMILVAYRSRHPEMAAQILTDLNKQYLAKHLTVYRPAGVYDFFHQQAEHYREQVQSAEKQLASYDLDKNSSDPELEKEILVKKAGEFEGDLRQTESAVADTQKRINELQSEINRTPARLTTQVTSGDNSQLLANLKSSLAELETRRVDLLTKYQPTYRLVQDVDKQIANLQKAIAAQNQSPVKQVSDAQNPTFLLLEAELVKANADLTGFQARARATAPVVNAYQQQALLIDQKGIQRQDLLRNIRDAEQDYTLYIQKQEQARISDELDKSRILNVAIAETPVVPSFPVYSPLLLAVAAAVVALMMSIAVAFVADYFDPTFRTPEEISAVMELPVLACFAKTDGPPRFGLMADGGVLAHHSFPGASETDDSLLLSGRQE
jgi:uncharacterized protein involved in exopolysaccharide biosynthesis